MKVKKALTFGLRVWPPLPQHFPGGFSFLKLCQVPQGPLSLLGSVGLLNFKEVQRTWGLLKMHTVILLLWDGA